MKEQKSSFLTVPVTPTYLRKFRRAAADHDLPMATYARSILESVVDHTTQKKSVVIKELEN